MLAARSCGLAQAQLAAKCCDRCGHGYTLGQMGGCLCVEGAVCPATEFTYIEEIYGPYNPLPHQDHQHEIPAQLPNLLNRQGASPEETEEDKLKEPLKEQEAVDDAVAQRQNEEALKEQEYQRKRREREAKLAMELEAKKEKVAQVWTEMCEVLEKNAQEVTMQEGLTAARLKRQTPPVEKSEDRPRRVQRRRCRTPRCSELRGSLDLTLPHVRGRSPSQRARPV